MAARIVLFGATGYTGDLTARALVDRGARPVLAARTESRVRAMADELGGLDWAVADVGDPASVRALVERGDVLVSTVGPFGRWGEPAVQAAVAGGAHYLDSTGEPPFIRQVFERFGRGAQSAGVALVTAMGYDWVPGNLAGALALRDAGAEAVRVEIGYFISGAASMSGGTRASSAAALLEPGFAWQGSRLVTERGARRARRFDVNGKARPAVSVGTSEHFSLPNVHPSLRDVDVYLGWFGPASRAMQAFSAGSSLVAKLPGVRAGLGAVTARVVKGSSGGPDAQTRARSSSLILANAYDASGTRLAGVRLEGVNGYDFTAAALAWGARTAAQGGLQASGALGPVDGFGLAALQAGVAEAGISRVE
jgi:short subunit dehydrogenase-like uncharacterized protein